MESGTSALPPFWLRALGWIEANLDYFDPFPGEMKPDDSREKALVELALLCLCLHRQPRFSVDARVRHFLQFIADIYSTPLYRERLFRVPDAFVPHALLIVTLTACGYLHDAPLRRKFQDLIDHSCVSFVERQPYRVLEVRHILDVGQFRHRLPSYAALYRSSMMIKHLNVIYMTDEDAYSITHALLYLSDFGMRPVLSLSPSHLKGLQWTLEQLLGMYTHKGNWDLVGELLLSCHCLKWTTSDFYALGWQALLAAQWPDGAVPGPAYKTQEMEGCEETRRREYVFRHCYHTTLVATLTGALCPYPGENNAT